ncbi:MAG TPA: glycosyltransferase family 4 protein [Solirubrobacteraceae bacterium]|nr:glycosyltransferase family 4 protein [Solirubrobacteraceae bacterium]
MRVLMVIQSYLPVLGGAQRQVQRLGPLLEAEGFEVIVVTRRPPGTPLREAQPGIQVRRVPGPDTGPGGSLNFTARAAREIVRLRPDVVHVHDLLSPATAALLGTALRPAPVAAKVLSTGPGGDVDRLLHKPAGAARLRLLARRFAAFVSLSADVEAELREHGVPADRVWRIPNGVDTGRFHPAASAGERRAGRAALGLPADDQPLWLYCGRFAPVKRVDLLVEALVDAPGRLLLVGEGGEEDALRRLVTERGLSDRVTLRPVVEDPAPLYRAADAYLSASTTEGMSGSVLEAMATAVPVVAAPASGMDELLGEGAGVLLADGAPSTFAAALGALAADPDRAAAVGGIARERAVADYSLQSTATQLARMYRAIAR